MSIGEQLYYAENILYPCLCIVAADAGNPIVLTGLDPAYWEKADRERWEYLNSTINGQLFKDFRLTPCAPGVELTNQSEPTSH